MKKRIFGICLFVTLITVSTMGVLANDNHPNNGDGDNGVVIVNTPLPIPDPFKKSILKYSQLYTKR